MSQCLATCPPTTDKPLPPLRSPQCTNICITDQGKSLYFGPYDPESLNRHLPVDHLLFATVEAGESGVQKPGEQEQEKKEDKAAPPAPSAAAIAAVEGWKQKASSGRKSFQRSSQATMKPSDSVSESLNKLAQEVG